MMKRGEVFARVIFERGGEGELSLCLFRYGNGRIIQFIRIPDSISLTANDWSVPIDSISHRIGIVDFKF